MTEFLPDTEPNELIERAGAGDRAALDQLVDRYRGRLRHMVAAQIDPRLSRRVDPSDVVQEACRDAVVHIRAFAAERPLPFYLWLRRLAWERLVEARRRHVEAGRRSVLREAVPRRDAADESAAALADRLVTSATSPSAWAIRRERRARLHEALRALSERDRHLLVMRYLEELTFPEMSQALGMQIKAVYARHSRALDRLRTALDADRDRGDF